MKVSVIIPCYNVAPFLERSINSVLAQSHKDLEIICIDDGSTDNTKEMLLNFQTEQAGLLQVITQSNKGACAARNAGMNRSVGSYLQFLDADDVLAPSKLEHQLSLAQEHNIPDLLIGSSKRVSASGETKETMSQLLGHDDNWLALLRSHMNRTSAILWKREAVANAGGWDEVLGSSQEYDLMFRMLRNGSTVVHDPLVLTEIHERPSGQISGTNLDKNWTRSVELRIRIIDHLKETRTDAAMYPYYQPLFDGIRILYSHDREKAIALYKQHIPRSWKPKTSNTSGRLYVLTHCLFGFSLANRIKSILA